VVFAVALLVVALRGLPVMNNLLSYFLGLVARFASHLEVSAENLLELFGATAIGSAAGWVSHHLPAWIEKSCRPVSSFLKRSVSRRVDSRV
jgi:predicted membrane protein